MAFHGKWIVARLQRLQRQLAAMPIADAKPTAGRSAAFSGVTWLSEIINKDAEYQVFIDVAKKLSPLFQEDYGQMSFTNACDDAQRLFLVSNYRAPQIVRVLQQLRVEWDYKLLPIDEKA